MVDTVKINKGNALMVAHRGLSGIETENTAAAFIAAANRSYYGIETDIHRTADGRFVCLHDEDTKRVAGRKVKAAKRTYDEIAGVTLKNLHDGVGPRKDLVPPTLEDYISICKKYGKHSVLELKDLFTVEELKKIIKIIKKLGHLEDTTFISFVPENLFNLRKLLPTHSVQALTDRMNDEILGAIVKYHLDVDIHFKALTEELVKTFKAHGLKINCWTVDDRCDAERLISWGVDYITSNILE